MPNLVPLLDTVTAIIPFLLIGAQFVELAVIDSALPAIADKAASQTSQDPKLNLSILIDQDGFKITGAGELLATEGGTDDATFVPCSPVDCAGQTENYDYATLRDRLLVVKAAWPRENNAIFVPDSRVPFDVLIHAMDAIRYKPHKADDKNPELLFPDIVFAAGVK